MTTESIETQTKTNIGFSGQMKYAENARFRTIIRQHAEGHGSVRKELRLQLVEYLRYSPNSDSLIDELIRFCVSLPSPDRLDIAIDVLSQIGRTIYDYAYRFLVDDIKKWSNLYPGRAYKPNDDYWYILLRSVAQSETNDDLKLSLVSMCCEATSRGVLEAVVEALGDIGDIANPQLTKLSRHDDKSIAELATEVLNQD